MIQKLRNTSVQFSRGYSIRTHHHFLLFFFLSNGVESVLLLSRLDFILTRYPSLYLITEEESLFLDLILCQIFRLCELATGTQHSSIISRAACNAPQSPLNIHNKRTLVLSCRHRRARSPVQGNRFYRFHLFVWGAGESSV